MFSAKARQVHPEGVYTEYMTFGRFWRNEDGGQKASPVDTVQRTQGNETSMKTIGWDDFACVELRVGAVTRVEKFPEACRPAYKIWADFGPEIGEKKCSAQLTSLYTPEDLLGRQILGVVNFPPKQIGPFLSEFLLTGFADAEGAIVIAVPERQVPNGAKLC